MVDLLGGIDYDKIKQKVLDIITAKDFKVLIIDSDGNVISDAKLSDIFGDLEALKGALQSVDTDKIMIDISEDDVGLAKDATLTTVGNELLSIKTQRYLGVLDLTIDSDETLDVSSGREVSFSSITLNAGGKLFVYGICRIYDNMFYVPEGTRPYVGEGGIMEVVGNA